MQIVTWLIVTLLCFSWNSSIDAVTPRAASKPVSNVINAIPSGGIVISTPGTYIFSNDITWNPSGAGQAILITASNVTLDLQNHTLASVTTAYNTVGIAAASVANLTIKNGTVANMAYVGISCTQCANVVIKKIIIDGLNLQNTGTYTVPVGILFTASKNVLIDKCKVKNINVMTGSTAAIQLTETLSSKVTNCHISNLLNMDGACTGIGHLLCDGAEVDSCTLDTLQSQFIDNLNTEGHTTIGLVPVASTNLKIKNCRISNIVGCCDDAHGISLFECLNAIVKNCTVKNVLDGAGAAQTGAKATGIEVYASGVNVIDCYVKNITAINPQDKQATGFSCAQCDGVQFIRCKAENVHVFDQYGNQSSSLGYGTGFGWAPDPRPEFIFPAVNILYEDCTAEWCQVGFDPFFHIDSVWKNLHSNYNGISILKLNHAQRTISCNPCSECGCTQVGCFPEPRTITIADVAKNNVFKNVKAKYRKNIKPLRKP